MARLLDSTPKQDGFRLPGEFEAKSGCWLGWPERTDVWRNGAKPAQKVWVQIVTAISHSEPVTVCALRRPIRHRPPPASPLKCGWWK